MGGNMTHMTHKWPRPKSPAKIPPHIVGIVGYWFSCANNANSYWLRGCWLRGCWLLLA